MLFIIGTIDFVVLELKLIPAPTARFIVTKYPA